MRKRRAPWLAGMLAALAACAPSPMPDAPPRGHPTLVSLNPCSDAVLVEVAAPGQILALSHYSRDPASSSMDIARARRLPSTTGSLEELVALRPDLVIADPFLPSTTAAALAGLGIPVARLPIATSVAQSREQVRTLARLAGRPERGEALVARIDAALARAAPPAGHVPETALVWQSGGIVPGEGSLIADLLRLTGFRSYSAERGLRQADYLPLEVLLADPPAIILAAGNPGAQEDRMLAHPALSAIAGTRRVRLDPSLLWCGGPTIARAAGRLAQTRRDAS